jgi:hypothetical protein
MANFVPYGHPRLWRIFIQPLEKSQNEGQLGSRICHLVDLKKELAKRRNWRGMPHRRQDSSSVFAK